MTRKLETVGKAMKEIDQTTLFRRVLSKDKHAAQLVEYRRALQDAIAKFQVGRSHETFVGQYWNHAFLFPQLMQCVRVDICMARIEKKQDTFINSYGRLAGLSSMDGYPPKEGASPWSSVAAIQGFQRCKNLVFILLLASSAFDNILTESNRCGRPIVSTHLNFRSTSFAPLGDFVIFPPPFPPFFMSG